MRIQKYKIFVLFLLGTSFFSEPVFSASVGFDNLDKGQLSLGVEYNGIYKKKMDPKDHADFKSIEIPSSNQVYGKVGYGVHADESWALDLFTKLGVADLSTEGIDAGLSNVERIDYQPGLLWGVGTNVKRNLNWLNVPSALSLQLQGTWWEADQDEIHYNSQKAFNITGAKHARVAELQAVVLLAAKLESPGPKGLKFEPYLGPIFNWMDMKTGRVSYETVEVTSTNAETGSESDNPVGIVVGVNILNVSESLKINLEGRFVSENAFTISIHYRF